MSRAITAASDAAASTIARPFRRPTLPATSTPSPSSAKATGVMIARVERGRETATRVRTGCQAAAPKKTAVAHQPASNGPPETHVPLAVRTR